MNRIARQARALGCAVAASLAAACANTSPCKTCAPAAPAGCATCDVGCQSTLLGVTGLKQQLRDVDWEQMRGDHCWPGQYNLISRERVGEPLKQQLVNGLAVEATVYDHHFLKEEGKHAVLSEPGKARLRYLARRKPFIVRQLYLQTSLDPALDQARERSVKEYLLRASLEPSEWAVAVVQTDVAGVAGVEAANAVTRMRGPDGGRQVATPQDERILKNTYYMGTGGGQPAGAGGGS